MLVLSRKRNESIMLGDDVKITVVSIKSNAVRLAIVAPSNIPVHRQEVWDDIQKYGSKRLTDDPLEE